MNVAQFIRTVLFERGVCGVPGLGVFSSYHEPARIHPEKNIFTPPCQKISFKARPAVNENEIIRFFALRSNITIAEADHEIRAFVTKIHQALSENGRFEIQGLGILYQAKSGDLEFRAEPGVEQSGDYFGLTPFFQAPSDKARTDSPVTESIETTRRNGNKWLIYAAIIFIAIGSALSLYLYPVQATKWLRLNISTAEWMVRLYRDRQMLWPALKEITAHDPDVDTYPGGVEIKPIVAEEKPAADSLVTIDTVVTQVTDTIPAPLPVTPPVFFVMAGVFESAAKAGMLVTNLKSAGYDANIIGRTYGGHHMVAYAGFSVKTDALSLLDSLHRSVDKTAWIYERKKP